MLRFVVCSVLVAGMVTSVFAEEEAAAQKSPSKVFVIELTRLHVKDAASAAGLRGTRLEDEIRNWRSSNRIVSEESLSLTSIEHVESTVQFGRRVEMVTGATSLGGRSALRTSAQTVGTLVRATISSQDDHIVVELNYESSNIEPAEDETSRGAISTTTVSTGLRLKPGEPQVITSSLAENQTVLLVKVSNVGEVPAQRREIRYVPTGPRRSIPSRTPPSRSGFGRPTPSRPNSGRTQGPPSNTSSQDRYAAFALALFKRYDTNEDGVIERSEAKQLRGDFSDYDLNDDGKLSTDEFVEYHTRRIPK